MRFINDIIKPLIRTAGSSALVVLGLLLSLSADAQGWMKFYGNDADEELTAIIENIDHGYTAVGRITTDSSDFEVLVIRTDVDGTLLWQRTYGTPDFDIEFGYDIVEAPNKDLIIVGETTGGPFADRDIYMLRLDEFGNIIWEKFFGTDDEDRGFGLNITQDGGFVVSGSSGDAIYVFKTDSDGNLEWETFLSGMAQGVPDEGVGNAVIETDNNNFFVVGSSGNNNDSDVYIARLNDTGAFLEWAPFGGNTNDVAYDIIRAFDGDYVITGKIGNSSDYYTIKIEGSLTGIDAEWSSIIDNGGTEEARAVVQSKDDNFILVGFAEDGPTDLQTSIVKLDASSGDSIWTKKYGRTGLDAANDVVFTKDGGIVLAGFTTEPATFFPQDALLIKADQNGEKVFTNHVVGNVYYDFNNSCTQNIGEFGIRNWIIKGEGNNNTYYTTTDVDGNYDLPLEAGNYTISVVRPNEYFQSNCLPITVVNFPGQNETQERNFPIDLAITCTDLEVDISTPFVEACEQATYTIDYCNHGTTLATNIEVALVISNNLDYISGPTPSVVTNDSLYIFEVNDLDIGQCGSFEIVVEADCDALLSETHSIKAEITPNDICLPDDPNWDGSSVSVNGYCDGDSVRFEITNTGVEAMDAGLDYIVVEDILIGLQQPNGPILDVNQTEKIAFEANGATYRLTARQSEGHPGNSQFPSIAVEGCVAGGGSDYTVGFYTQLPEDDADHFLAHDCQENIPSTFESNIKRGYPKGYGDSTKISSLTDLTYHIKFQNTGTDTAIRVVIRDTISAHLDPQTVRPGASSHDFDFEVYDDGVLKFTFNNIMLADSNTNEAASHGFVKYRISQKPDNPLGTVIKNGAAIYFDYQAPTTTDSICHLVSGMEWEDFIIVSDQTIYIPQTDIKIYPNPVTQFATFELSGVDIYPPLDLEVFDVSGRLVRSERFYSTTFQFAREDLSNGLYFYQLSSQNQLIATGKMIAK